VTGGRGYSELIRLPIFGLYADDQLIATVRAGDIQEARVLFKRAGMKGGQVRQLSYTASDERERQ
jgi:hypothetical protein